jgi:hypothetical protein
VFQAKIGRAIGEERSSATERGWTDGEDRPPTSARFPPRPSKRFDHLRWRLGAEAGKTLMRWLSSLKESSNGRREEVGGHKGIAEPFDVAKVDFYKALQRKMSRGLAPVMELEAEDGASVSDTTITVFGTDRSDLRRLGTVRREVHVALLDSRSDEGAFRSRLAGALFGEAGNSPGCSRPACGRGGPPIVAVAAPIWRSSG